MLRIQRHDVNVRTTVLQLEGDIFGDWSDLLESESLQSTRAGRRVVLDLSGVVFVAHSGIDVLRRLADDGVRIAGVPSLLADVLEHEGIDVDRAAAPATTIAAATLPGNQKSH